MNRRNAVSLAALAFAGAAYAAWWWHDGAEDRMRAAAEAQWKVQREREGPAIEQRRQRQATEQANAYRRPSRDNSGLTTAFPEPTSAWQAAERAWATKRLARGHYGTLVVPVQSALDAFDRATRSYLTARFTAALADAGGGPLPDPWLVQRALGDGFREVARADVFRLADSVGAKRVVWLYAGHDERGNIALHLQYQDRDAQGLLDDGCPIVARQFEDTVLGPAGTPIGDFEARIPVLLEMLGFTTVATAATPTSNEPRALPDSAEALDRFPTDPAHAARVFQLLAELAPPWEERARERNAERSMLALRHLVAGSEPVLEARAWMLLGYRNAALAALGRIRGAEAEYLRTVLDGDLVGARRRIAAVPAGAETAIALLDLRRMESSYLVRPAELRALAVGALPRDWIWPDLLAQELWQEPALATATPRDRACLFVQLTRSAAACDAERMDLIEATRAWRERAEPGAIVAGLLPIPRREDFVDLLEAFQVDSDLAGLRTVRWTYDSAATESLAQLAPLEAGPYREHPRLLAWRAWLELQLARQAEAGSRAALVSAARRDSELALRFEHGQSRTSAIAAEARGKVDELANDGEWLPYPFQRDMPFHPYFPIAEATEAGLKVALSLSTYDTLPLCEFGDLVGRIQGRWGEDEAQLRGDPNHFAGAPCRNRMLADARLNQGAEADAERILRDAVKQEPLDWETQQQLATILFRRGDAAGAARVYEAYAAATAPPGWLRESVPNAYEFGSRFYWAGELALARPYYRAAMAEPGEAGLTSRIRLHLADGEIEEARELSERRAEEHASAFAYRDFFALRFAAGEDEGLETRFEQISAKAAPYVWDAMLVGQRRHGEDEATVAAWAADPAHSGVGDGASFAARFLAKSGTMDRVPTAALSERIAGIDMPIFRVRNEGRPVWVVRPQRNGSPQHLLGPHAPEDSFLPLNEFDTGEKQRVRSDLAEFTEAYRDLSENRSQAAFDRLAGASKDFDFTRPDMGHMLVYYAWAAARLGRGPALRALLDSVPVAQRGFHDALARAVLLALAGKDAEAGTALRMARFRRDAVEAQPVSTMYLYAETCEWLFKATKREPYRRMALDWVRAVQSMQPWQAWAYSIEAVLAPDPERRGYAIAMTSYLDPRSARLSTLSSGEVERAIATHRAKNPFLRRKASGLHAWGLPAPRLRTASIT